MAHIKKNKNNNIGRDVGKTETLFHLLVGMLTGAMFWTLLKKKNLGLVLPVDPQTFTF